MDEIPEGLVEAVGMELPEKKPKKKRLLIGVIVGIVVLGLGGLTAGLKYRDYLRAEREKWYAEQEANDKAEVFSLTITPGETIFEVREKLIGVGYSESEVETALRYDYDFDFLPDLASWEGSAAAAAGGYRIEGYLYGETHEFYKDATAEEVIVKFLEGMGEVIAENNLVERYAERGLSLQDGVTLASVVQKEAHGPEMATVAQVFLNRLADRTEVMGILGSDVTSSYALDILDPSREIYTNNAAALSVDSCYNTRLYAGLPCGPIANPGLTALLAVAEPTDSAYLYFLTGDDGMMYYSYTESEHLQKIRDHCRVLCNVQL